MKSSTVHICTYPNGAREHKVSEPIEEHFFLLLLVKYYMPYKI